MLDPSFLGMLAVLAALSAIAYAQGGNELLGAGLGEGLQMILRFALLIVVAFLVAGVAQTIVPHEWVRDALGEDSGMRGLALATVAGAIVPSGPFVSMPIAATLLKSGASTSAVVAFVASWSLLAVHRLFIWEMSLLGWRFALIRYASCLLLPIAAGLLVRAFYRA